MKLLLDQNISRYILEPLREKYPGSDQVFLLDLAEASDKEIWDFAKEGDFTIVTKDSDFEEMSLVYGSPPKVIWLRCGNQTNKYILDILLQHIDQIMRFYEEKKSVCLELY